MAGLILACANSLAYDACAVGVTTIVLAFARPGTLVSGRPRAKEQRRQYEAGEGWILAGAVRRNE